MNEAKKDILIGFLIYTAELILFYYLWKNNIVLTIALVFVSVFVLLKWTDKEGKFVYFAGFILGLLIELTLVPTGIWSYGNPTIFGIPLWLPLGYGIGAVVAIKAGKSVSKLF
ncbi:hypothetical protein HYX03_01945 [Candidatus Woesearchaeota archaeon]|nr:hypothetical protein [Candidatus Woesearchaeota archaeon]